jgi:hypothetical protein
MGTLGGILPFYFSANSTTSWMPPSKSRWIISTAPGNGGGKQGADERRIGANDDGISRHRIRRGPRHRTPRLEMVGVGCGRRDNGQRADPISGGGRSREAYRSGFSSKKGATTRLTTAARHRERAGIARKTRADAVDRDECLEIIDCCLRHGARHMRSRCPRRGRCKPQRGRSRLFRGPVRGNR